ncbi:hypothetical protein BDQ17DRAFT_1482213 [Cyathus striatus]|nr:hypothetical protein BDQ17DRAFT_1482213 [Cyathus striatus]
MSSPRSESPFALEYISTPSASPVPRSPTRRGFSPLLQSPLRSPTPEPRRSASVEHHSRSHSPANEPPIGEYLVPEEELVPAFSESPAIRLLYLQTVIGSIFGSRTVLQASETLTDVLDVLELAGNLPNPGANRYIAPARTLITAKRRLGLDADQYIERRPICTVCYKFYSMDEIEHMEIPDCIEEGCKGFVYREKRMADNTMKRIPAKIHCYSSLVKSISRFLLRSDFVKNLRDTSEDYHRTQVVRSEHDLLHDVHDGEAWTQMEAGLKREIGANGIIQDVEQYHGSRKPLVKCDVGLNMTFNLDWFGITDNRPHSTGALYGCFNNLHRSVRYLPRNIYLAMTIPGPKEPSLDQMNYLLTPLVEDLKCLYTGIA